MFVVKMVNVTYTPAISTSKTETHNSAEGSVHLANDSPSK